MNSPRDIVGMAFQNPVLLEWRSILKNVMLPLEIVSNSLSSVAREQRALDLLKLVLSGFEDKKPSELSGGMRQRASLCRALVHKPEILILDEPFGALDAFTREDLWQTMHQLQEQEPFTGVLITHDLREAIFLADEVVVLSGRPATTQFKQKMMEMGQEALTNFTRREQWKRSTSSGNKLKLPVKMRALSHETSYGPSSCHCFISSILGVNSMGQ